MRQSGQWINVSRLGPPAGERGRHPVGQEGPLQRLRVPRNDAQFASFVLNPELGGLIPALYPGVTVPPNPRNDLVSVFLTGIPGLNQPPNVKPAELLRLNMAIPPVPLKPGDDPFEQREPPRGRSAVTTRASRTAAVSPTTSPTSSCARSPVAIVLTPDFNRSPNNILGDGVNKNDRAFLARFPYVGTPHQGYDHDAPRRRLHEHVLR